MTAINIPIAFGVDNATDPIAAGQPYTDVNPATSLGNFMDSVDEWIGLRFRNVLVPRGSIINSASISVVPSASTTDEPLVTIYGEAADNPGVFTTGGGDVSMRPRTAASVLWSDTNLGADGSSRHDSPDISAIIQEIVDRPGWVSGNSLVIIIQGGNDPLRDLLIRSFASGLGTPELDIDYTPPLITSGPTVSYQIGFSHAGPDAPMFVVSFAVSESVTWEIWTGQGQSGTLLDSGSLDSGTQLSRPFAWNAVGLNIGINTIYLWVDADLSAQTGESSATVAISPTSSIPAITEDQSLTGEFGPVVVRFRYERRTRNFAFLAPLIGVVLSAEVRLDNFRPVPMDCTLTMLPDDLPDDWRDAREYVSITREFLVGSEWVPYTVGLFRLNEPVADTRPNDDEVWTVTGFDLAGELADIRISAATTYASGTNIITAVRGLLNTYEYRHDLPDSDDVLTADVPIPPNTTVLDHANKLLNAMGMHNLYPDQFGVFRTQAIQAPATNPFVVHYTTEHEPRYILPPWRPTTQSLQQPNRVAIVTEDPAQPIAALVRLNNDPTSVMSIVSRGYEDSVDIPGAHMVSDTVRELIADWHLQVAAAHAVTASLLTTMDPRRRNHEVYQLEIEGRENHTRWLVFGWSMKLEPGGIMTHRIGRADPLLLEDE